MKKIAKNKRLTVIIPIICIIVIIGIIIGANVIKVNIANGKYNSSNSGSNNKNLIPEYIKEGITLGGITGTLKVLDTSDATAKPEDIIKGKTAYVNGVKITGTKITREILKIGDYVEYTPDTASTYSLTSAVSGYTSNQSIPQETLNWQIMSINEDGTVDLISENPTVQSVTLAGSLGYNNGVLILNEICKQQYSNKNLGVIARSIKIEDVETKLSEYGIKAKEDYIANEVKYNGSRTYSVNTNYPNLYNQEIKSGVNSDNPKENGIGVSENYYSSPTNETYSKANKLTISQTIFSFSNTPSNYFINIEFYNLIFGTDKNYWIASRYTYCRNDFADFGVRYVTYNSNSNNKYIGGYGLMYSNSNTNTGSNLLRPVVTLGANVEFSSGDGSIDNPYKISI